MPSDIFWFPAIWLTAAAGSFLRYLDRGPKELFFSNKPWGEDNFQTQNTTQKVDKSTLSILKIVQYSELTSADLVPSLKCTFLRPKCEIININIEKTLASATCLDSNAPHIFSYSSKIYVYSKYKYYNVQLILKHNIFKIYLKCQV
jgi:hypothetical protein